MEIIIICIFGVCLLVFVVYYSKKQKEQQVLLLKEQLQSFQQTMALAMQNNNSQLHAQTMQGMHSVEQNVSEYMYKGFEANHNVYKEVLVQVSKLSESQRGLHQLSKDIHALHQILNDKKTRGIYGEIQLYSLLENAYGQGSEFYAKQFRLSTGVICDAILFSSTSMHNVVIDSKFPLENFNRIHDSSLHEQERKQAKIAFKNDVKKHIQDIAQKYILVNETSEFAFMFIPAEAIFSYIHAYMEELVHYAYQNKVYFASPTSLMAYISAIQNMYLDKKRSDRILDVQVELQKLEVEFTRFHKRCGQIQKDYEKLSSDLKDVMISANKIQTRFQKIRDVEIEEV